MRPSPADAARTLVQQRFPDAVQAWLAGSTTTGRATRSSDLDVTVLLEDAEVRRESMEHDGWPVELFVHTPASVRHFVAKDLVRRHPTMARLVATGVPLLDTGRDDGGAEIRRHCEQVLATGPGPLGEDALDLMRYGLTDVLDDLADVGPGAEATAVATAVWAATAELALGVAGTWSGTGKWLVRELRALDDRAGTRLTVDLDDALRRAVLGHTAGLVAVADSVLDRCGGRLWAGLYLRADLSES